MEDLRIAQWLDATITADGTKIRNLARHVGVSVSQVSKWKSGEQPLKKPDYVFKIAEFYDVDPLRLMATADPAFRAQGIDPLPIPELGEDHMISRIPRYVGKRERALMDRIARLGVTARGEVGEASTGRVEQAFQAIDEMLDHVQEMLNEGRATRERSGPADGQHDARGGGPVETPQRAGRRDDKADRAAQRERRAWRLWPQAPDFPPIQGAMAFGL